jgi:hypothetical protein
VSLGLQCQWVYSVIGFTVSSLVSSGLGFKVSLGLQRHHWVYCVYFQVIGKVEEYNAHFCHRVYGVFG